MSEIITRIVELGNAMKIARERSELDRLYEKARAYGEMVVDYEDDADPDTIYDAWIRAARKALEHEPDRALAEQAASKVAQAFAQP